MRLRLVLAVGADDRKPLGQVAADDATEQSERGPVRPLQVVEYEQQPAARDRGESLLDGGCVERRVAGHADGVGERLVRDERLLAARAVENRRPVGCALDGIARCEARLATAGLSGDQRNLHRLAALAQPSQPRELGRPAEEERRVDSTELCGDRCGRRLGS